MVFTQRTPDTFGQSCQGTCRARVFLEDVLELGEHAVRIEQLLPGQLAYGATHTRKVVRSVPCVRHDGSSNRLGVCRDEPSGILARSISISSIVCNHCCSLHADYSSCELSASLRLCHGLAPHLLDGVDVEQPPHELLDGGVQRRLDRLRGRDVLTTAEVYVVAAVVNVDEVERRGSLDKVGPVAPVVLGLFEEEALKRCVVTAAPNGGKPMVGTTLLLNNIFPAAQYTPATACSRDPKRSVLLPPMSGAPTRPHDRKRYL